MGRRIGVLLALAVMAVATGCETIKGVGRDLSNAGTALQKIGD